jgi:hypothetical protein
MIVNIDFRCGFFNEYVQRYKCTLHQIYQKKNHGRDEEEDDDDDYWR